MNQATNTSISHRAYGPEYTSDRWSRYNHAMDARNILARPATKEVNEFLFFTLCEDTQRTTFLEPTLRMFLIKSRSKLINYLQRYDKHSYSKIAAFQLAMGRLPVDMADFETFDKDGISTYASYNRGWAQQSIPPTRFLDLLANYKKLAKVLDQISVWEWASAYITEIGIRDMMNRIEANRAYVKKLSGQDLLPLNKPYNVVITTYDDFLPILISLGERPDVK